MDLPRRERLLRGAVQLSSSCRNFTGCLETPCSRAFKHVFFPFQKTKHMHSMLHKIEGSSQVHFFCLGAAGGCIQQPFKQSASSALQNLLFAFFSEGGLYMWLSTCVMHVHCMLLFFAWLYIRKANLAGALSKKLAQHGGDHDQNILDLGRQICSAS